jgi:hypothetical protein
VKITVVTCDNCGQRCDEKSYRMDALSQDWCYDCKSGFIVDLKVLPFHNWPNRVMKESVREVIELWDNKVKELKDELRNVHKANKAARDELRKVRRQAADAYAGSNRPQEDLKDIATAARREED